MPPPAADSSGTALRWAASLIAPLLRPCLQPEHQPQMRKPRMTDPGLARALRRLNAAAVINSDDRAIESLAVLPPGLRDDQHPSVLSFLFCLRQAPELGYLSEIDPAGPGARKRPGSPTFESIRPGGHLAWLDTDELPYRNFVPPTPNDLGRDGMDYHSNNGHGLNGEVGGDDSSQTTAVAEPMVIDGPANRGLRCECCGKELVKDGQRDCCLDPGPEPAQEFGDDATLCSPQHVCQCCPHPEYFVSEEDLR